MAQMKTWPIECDEPMLEMLAFAVETMGHMLKEQLDEGGVCECGAKRRSIPEIKRDIKTANRILAQAFKGKMNLEMARSFEVRGKTVVAKKRGAKR